MIKLKKNIVYWGIVGLLCAVLIILIAEIFVGKSPDAKDASVYFQECFTKTLGVVKIDTANSDEYIKLWNLCNQQIYENLRNDDFAIRHEKFRRQEFDERVNLWMVVLITLSGVVLSAVQLFLSAQLLQSGHKVESANTQIAIEYNKLSIKSSVTGLAILIISLAFFFVYVGWIYRAEVVGDSAPTPNSVVLPRKLSPGKIVNLRLPSQPSGSPISQPPPQ